MIVYDFNFVRAGVSPNETYPVLIVDANAIMPFPIACQRFQPIAGRNAQFVECCDGVKLVKFSGGNFPKRLRASFSRFFGVFSVEDVFRAFVFEGDDHAKMIAWKSCYCNSPTDCELYQRQIAAADKQIDALVYNLSLTLSRKTETSQNILSCKIKGSHCNYSAFAG